MTVCPDTMAPAKAVCVICERRFSASDLYLWWRFNNETRPICFCAPCAAEMANPGFQADLIQIKASHDLNKLFKTSGLMLAMTTAKEYLADQQQAELATQYGDAPDAA